MHRICFQDDAECLFIGRPDKIEKSVHGIRFHQVDGAAAEAAAHLPGAEYAGEIAGFFYEEICFRHTDFVFVVQSVVALKHQFAKAGQVAVLQGMAGGFHTGDFFHHEFAAQEHYRMKIVAVWLVAFLCLRL